MNDNMNIHNHDIAETLLDDYVLGTLPSDQSAWMNVHTETCEICQGEIPELREILLVLPFAVDDAPIEMSSDLWDRIELSIQGAAPTQSQSQSQSQGSISSKPPKSAPTPTLTIVPSSEASAPSVNNRETGSLSRFTWLALAAAAVALLGLGAMLGQRFDWFGDSSSDSMQDIAIHNSEGEPLEVAQLQYMPEEHIFVLKMDGMPEAPEGQVYQAWFISGDTPINMGLINPATGEFAVSGERENYDAFAITMEPGPMGSEQPTSAPIAVAPLVPDT